MWEVQETVNNGHKFSKTGTKFSKNTVLNSVKQVLNSVKTGHKLSKTQSNGRANVIKVPEP